MFMEVWSVYDCESNIYGQPIFFRNNDIAQATFKRDVKMFLAEDASMAAHLENKQFVNIAKFDDEKGYFVNYAIEDQLTLNISAFVELYTEISENEI